ncbi:MAG: hypothetical protein ABSE97_01085 [Verrucomicrobiota bacterium]|jgi:hypothetical protein
MKTIKKTFGIVACVGILAASATSVLGQSDTETLAYLAGTPGATLTVDDKTFSGFYYLPSDLVSFDPNTITVTATESGGIDYLTWSGNMSLVSGGVATADLLLHYIVTSTGGPIDMIDQAYTGNAENGWLSVDETAALGAFGGIIVGSSHLTGIIPSNPPSYANDNLNIVPPETVLYVTKDLGFGVSSLDGGFITISQVGQSFHQEVPEPSAMLLGSLGSGLLLFLRSRRQARRD